jgi:hypothetical protein
MFKIILLIFLCQSVYAQELLNLINDDQDELILIEENDLTSDSLILDETETEKLQELREQELESVNQIVNSKFKKYDETQKEVVRIKTEDILKSPTFKGYVNKGVLLYNLVTGKQEKLTQNAYVKAYSLIDSEGYYYLQNENGNVIYKVAEKDIAKIELVSNMYEPPARFQTVVKEKKDFNLTDDKLSFTPIFNYHTGRTRPTFMRDLTNDSTHTGNLTRLELKTMGKFNFPVDIGLSLIYTQIKAQIGTGGENYSQTSMAIGPSLSINNIMENLLDINLISSFHSSMFSQLSEVRAGQTLNYDLTQSMFLIGIEKPIKIFLGTAFVGMNFQRQWTKASSDEFNADINSQNNYDDSYALSFGWGFDWDIF